VRDAVRRLAEEPRPTGSRKLTGRIDNWIAIRCEKSIEDLARTLIPVLGSDRFFELH
jgi:hypothetical protein